MLKYITEVQHADNQLKHILEFVRNVKETGAIAPSSRFLTKDLVEYLEEELSDETTEPLNILEIGPGTGSLTKQILKRIRPQDQLDIIELNDYFYGHMIRNYRQANVEIHNGDFLNVETGRAYDYIFSSLPYESIPEELSQQIWEKKLAICKENALISYYKYLNFKKTRCTLERELNSRYRKDKKFVFLNLPPARCYTLEVNPTPPG